MNGMTPRAVLLALGLLAGTASAEDIKPGLWEMQIREASGKGAPDVAEMKKAMQQMQAQMANLPPEQRKMMEAHMNNMGVSMSGSGFRICLTPEDVRRQDIPMNDDNCKTTVTERSAKRWTATAVCQKPVMTGRAEAVFHSPVAYTVTVNGTTTEQGKKEPFSMIMDWKFVAADCGKVRPHSASAAAGKR